MLYAVPAFAESEMGELVGEYAPAAAGNASGAIIAWQDGMVTRAVKQGGYLGLTHLEAGGMA